MSCAQRRSFAFKDNQENRMKYVGQIKPFAASVNNRTEFRIVIMAAESLRQVKESPIKVRKRYCRCHPIHGRSDQRTVDKSILEIIECQCERPAILPKHRPADQSKYHRHQDSNKVHPHVLKTSTTLWWIKESNQCASVSLHVCRWYCQGHWESPFYCLQILTCSLRA